MSPEHNAKSASVPKSGCFALLSSVLYGKGSGVPPIVRSRGFIIAAVLLAVSLCSLALTVASALAAPPSEFGEEGSGAGQLNPHVTGIAIEQQSGDVWVNDGFNSRADKFGPEGQFLLSLGWGVANGAAELQTCGPEASPPTVTCQQGIISIFAAGVGQFGLGPSGVAVDNSGLPGQQGDVYFNDSPGRVTKFGPRGEFLLMLGKGVDQGPHHPGNLCTDAFIAAGDTCGAAAEGSGPGEFERLGGNPLAVDSAGTLYVGGRGRIQYFSSTGAFEGQISLPGVVVAQLAVDSAKDLYVVSESSELSGVHKYDPAGVELGEPRDPSTESFNDVIAVGPADRLFVAKVSNAEAFLSAIDVFDSSGKQVMSFPESRTPGLAYGNAIERIYALPEQNTKTAIRLLSPPPPGPLLVPATTTANEIGKTHATVCATVNPEGAPTTVHFQYVDSESFEKEGGFASPHTKTTTESASSGSDFEFRQACQEVSGLVSATTYRFRVIATNSDGPPAGVPGEAGILETLPPFSLDATFATEVTDTAAILGAEVNPLGDPATCHFEYLSQAEYLANGESFAGPDPATVLPLSGASIASSQADVLLSQPIAGLAPSTVYRYRIVLVNAATPAPIPGPTESLTTQGAVSTVLPDSRAYELVSPPNKHGTALEPLSEPGGVVQAAADGSAIAYYAHAPITSDPSGNRSIEDSQFLARRGAAGWSTIDISTPHQAPIGVFAGNPSEYKLFSSDLSLAAVQPFGATPLSSQASERTPYLRQSDGTYIPLVTEENVPPGIKFGGKETSSESFEGGVGFITGTPDLARLLLESRQPLTEDFISGFKPSSERSNDYEWSAGVLQLVSWIPTGTATACGGAGPVCLPAAEVGRSSDIGGGYQVRNAISADGSRVVFQINPGSPSLYLRDLSSGETVALDTAQPGAAGESGGSTFQLASTDGSRVFFTDQSRLTANSIAAQVGKPDLYMCQVEVKEGRLACALTDLTASTVNPSEPAAVQGDVIGAADDGSFVYFVANGVLTAGEGAVHGNCNGNGVTLAQQSCNLYFYDTETATTRLVAVLSGDDFHDWLAGSGVDLGTLTARVSANGRYLAFMSERPLTGYDSRDAISGQPDQEVFLYDAQAAAGKGKLLCASCNPTGARPHGVVGPEDSPWPLVDGPGNWRNRWTAANVPGWTRVDLSHALYQSRYLSDSGRLFFDSSDALVPRDSNGTQDVYEFEFPRGAGQSASDTCTTLSSTYSPVSGGCVSLVSSGVSPVESAFLDASESGDDVFFLTASTLVSRDVDKALDLYDARVGGGEPEPVMPVECQGDACQSLVQAPNDPTPGSLTFSGPGNPIGGLRSIAPLSVKKTVKCKKSKKLSHGGCPKTKSKKKGRAKKAKRANRNRRASR